MSVNKLFGIPKSRSVISKVGSMPVAGRASRVLRKVKALMGNPATVYAKVA